MEILWKGTVSTEFRANRPKLCGNCTFPQNFHTRKLVEITVFFAAAANWYSHSAFWKIQKKSEKIFRFCHIKKTGAWCLKRRNTVISFLGVWFITHLKIFSPYKLCDVCLFRCTAALKIFREFPVKHRVYFSILWSFLWSCSEQLLCREPVSTCFCKKDVISRIFENLKNTQSWRR